MAFLQPVKQDIINAMKGLINTKMLSTKPWAQLVCLESTFRPHPLPLNPQTVPNFGRWCCTGVYKKQPGQLSLSIEVGLQLHIFIEIAPKIYKF